MKKAPQRRCVGCRESKDQQNLIRLAKDTEGNLSLEPKSPGRGVYLCRNADCLVKARKSKGLERSLKRAVPPEIYESLEALLFVY